MCVWQCIFSNPEGALRIGGGGGGQMSPPPNETPLTRSQRPLQDGRVEMSRALLDPREEGERGREGKGGEGREGGRERERGRMERERERKGEEEREGGREGERMERETDIYIYLGGCLQCVVDVGPLRE